METLVGQVEIEVPEHLLNSEIDARRKQITEQLAQAGLTVEQYLADIGEDQTEDEFWADLEERSAQALKAQIILDKVAEEHSIDVDQNDFTQHIVRKAQADGVPPQQVADHLKEHPHHIEEYMLEIRRGKALAMIVESATVTDSNGSVIELARLRDDGSYADSEAEPADEEGEIGRAADGRRGQGTERLTKIAASVGELTGRVAVGRQDLRTGRKLLKSRQTFARTHRAGMINRTACQDHLANLIVNSNNYYDSSANALDNLENLAYSRGSGLIAGETAMTSIGPLG